MKNIIISILLCCAFIIPQANATNDTNATIAEFKAAFEPAPLAPPAPVPAPAPAAVPVIFPQDVFRVVGAVATVAFFLYIAAEQIWYSYLS